MKHATAPSHGDTATPSLRTTLSDEEGAQAVEYAMVGGLGAGLIGLLWTIISRTGLVDRVVEQLLAAIVELIRSWF